MKSSFKVASNTQRTYQVQIQPKSLSNLSPNEAQDLPPLQKNNSLTYNADVSTTA